MCILLEGGDRTFSDILCTSRDDTRARGGVKPSEDISDRNYLRCERTDIPKCGSCDRFDHAIVKRTRRSHPARSIQQGVTGIQEDTESKDRDVDSEIT